MGSALSSQPLPPPITIEVDGVSEQEIVRFLLTITRRDQLNAEGATWLGRGFVECEPFADYRPDPLGVFMTRALNA